MWLLAGFDRESFWTKRNRHPIQCDPNRERTWWVTGDMYGMQIQSPQLEFIYHIHLIPMTSKAGLKCHLRGHGHRNETDVITSDVKDEEAALVRISCGNYHIYTKLKEWRQALHSGAVLNTEKWINWAKMKLESDIVIIQLWLNGFIRNVAASAYPNLDWKDTLRATFRVVIRVNKNVIVNKRTWFLSCIRGNVKTNPILPGMESGNIISFTKTRDKEAFKWNLFVINCNRVFKRLLGLNVISVPIRRQQLQMCVYGREMFILLIGQPPQ